MPVQDDASLAQLSGSESVRLFVDRAALALASFRLTNENARAVIELAAARVHLGYVALRAGNLGEAREIFAETARSFQQDGSTIGVVFALEGLAALSLAVGKPDHAARLIGWADAARLRIRNPRPFLEQAHVDQVIAACHTRMGEAAFSDVYEVGEKMTLDDAVAYALRWAPEI